MGRDGVDLLIGDDDFSGPFAAVATALALVEQFLLGHEKSVLGVPDRGGVASINLDSPQVTGMSICLSECFTQRGGSG